MDASRCDHEFTPSSSSVRRPREDFIIPPKYSSYCTHSFRKSRDYGSLYHNKFDRSSSLHVFYGNSTGTIRFRIHKSPKEKYIGS